MVHVVIVGIVSASVSISKQAKQAIERCHNKFQVGMVEGHGQRGGLHPGIDMVSVVIVKPDAPQVLKQVQDQKQPG